MFLNPPFSSVVCGLHSAADTSEGSLAGRSYKEVTRPYQICELISYCDATVGGTTAPGGWQVLAVLTCGRRAKVCYHAVAAGSPMRRDRVSALRIRPRIHLA